MTASPPTLSAADFAAKWRDNRAARARLLAGALHRPLPPARRADAQRGRPRRRVVYLRGRRGTHQHRPQGLGRRLAARLLRLGVQGRARRPRRRLPPAARLPRGPREPARARRQRHGPDRGPHQLHQHPPRGPPHHPRRPRSGRRAHGRGAARAARRDARARGAAAGADARRDHRARRGALRRDRPLDARSRLPPGGRRPPPQPRRLLPLRRGRAAAPGAHPHRHDRVAPRRPGGVHARPLRAVPADVATARPAASSATSASSGSTAGSSTAPR